MIRSQILSFAVAFPVGVLMDFAVGFVASLVRAWPTLSEQAKADVLAVINASQQEQSATECK